MVETLVWMLISVSLGQSNAGNVTVVGHFKDVAQCEHVRKNIPLQSSRSARCVQAYTLLPKENTK